MTNLSTDKTMEMQMEMQILQTTKKNKSKKEKKEKNVIIMGPNSYENISIFNNEKQERMNQALEKVKNKTFTKDDLKKTKICRNKDCSWGSECDYAHSLEELQVHDCAFGDDCKHVYEDVSTECGKVVICNNSGKICRYRHTSETMEECKTRIGLISETFEKLQDFPLPPRKSPNAPCLKIDLTPTITQNIPMPQAPYPPLATPPLPPMSLQAPYPPLAPPPLPPMSIQAPHPPLAPQPSIPLQAIAQPMYHTRVIQVPKELGLQALEMAMKSNNGNIRIELI